MWSALIKRVQGAKRKFASDEKFKMQIDELVSIMVFTRVEMKAAGLFNIDLSVITSVSDDNVVNDYFSTYQFNEQIVSSIATYLVVLVQFKMSEEGNRNSSAHEDLQQFVGRMPVGNQP